MTFSFEDFAAAVRDAASSENANTAVRELLTRTVANPEPIIAATRLDGDDEICLYEDDSVSIWVCRFQPHIVMPPHEHLLDVHIAGYSGGEKNILFRIEDGALKHDRTEIVAPGSVLTLSDDAVHAVSAEGDEPSLALHVYMGPLMKLKRALFDWETGEKIEFS
ncbi:MAG: hypothetical protein AAF441_23475, partial [Pseudomonadota bacterium]